MFLDVLLYFLIAKLRCCPPHVCPSVFSPSLCWAMQPEVWECLTHINHFLCSVSRCFPVVSLAAEGSPFPVFALSLFALLFSQALSLWASVHLLIFLVMVCLLSYYMSITVSGISLYLAFCILSSRYSPSPILICSFLKSKNNS